MNFIIKNKLIIIFSICFSSILVFILMGYDNFSMTGYLYSENYDLVSEQLAYKFFINDKWHFPFGVNQNYGMDIGNSIVFSGGPTIIIFIIKLFKSYLPEDFQYFIIWYILCFSLQLIISYLIILHFTKNKIFSLLSSFLFLLSPILLYRIPIHTSLIAHWIILICFYFEIKKINISRVFFYSTMLSVSLLVHFYFVPMVLIIKYSFIINEIIKTRKLKKYIKEIVIPILVLFFVGYITGYFVISGFDAMGFGYGYYSFNLTGLIDSQSLAKNLDWSFFFSDIKNTKGQAEGFSYLGFGGILLLIFLVINFFQSKKKIDTAYLLIILICFFIAVSNIVYFADNIVFEYHLPKIIYGLLSIIRASGRFIWLIYYLIFIFGIISIYQFFNKSKKSEIIILLVLILQLVDIHPALKNYYNAHVFKIYNDEFDDKIFWSKISNDFKIVRTTYVKNTSKIFPSTSNQILKNSFIQTDIARLGRFDRTKASKIRNKLYSDLNNKTLDQKTIYIIDNDNHLRYLKYLYEDSDFGFFFRNNVWFMIPNYKSKMTNEDYLKFIKINPIKINLNTEHIFDSRSEKNALGFGWSHSTQRGVWTEGNKMNIFFSFKPKVKKIHKIKLKINSSFSDVDKDLTGSIYLNDEKIKDFKFKSFKNSQNTFLEIIIPNTKLEDNIYKLDIKIDNPISPLKLFKSADARMLGLLIESFEIN